MHVWKLCEFELLLHNRSTSHPPTALHSQNLGCNLNKTEVFTICNIQAKPALKVQKKTLAFKMSKLCQLKYFLFVSEGWQAITKEVRQISSNMFKFSMAMFHRNGAIFTCHTQFSLFVAPLEKILHLCKIKTLSTRSQAHYLFRNASISCL